jgi:hypothetical protein
MLAEYFTRRQASLVEVIPGLSERKKGFSYGDSSFLPENLPSIHKLDSLLPPLFILHALATLTDPHTLSIYTWSS